MNEEEVKELIVKLMEGTINEADRARLEAWYLSFESEEGFTKTLAEHERILLEQAIWEKVRSKLNAQVGPGETLRETGGHLEHEAGQGAGTEAAGDPGSRQAPKLKVRPWHRKLGRVAAILGASILLSGAVMLYLNLRSRTVLSTGYGEIMNVVLPDSSKVVLNGNSRLRYSKNWEGEGPREVWLEGEAFFTVARRPPGQQFIVHASSDFKVQVLGTSFNVDHRGNAVEVVLNEGSIRLRYGSKDTLTLEPGSYVRYEKSTATLREKTVQAVHYSSWTERREYFDNAPISEVVSLLENTYGYRVEVKDPAILRKKVVGSMPTSSMEGFLKALAKAVNLRITQEGRHILIENEN